MVLPKSPSILWLLSFWLAATTVLTSLVTGLVAWYGGLNAWMLVSVLLIGAAVTLAGAVKVPALAACYAAWNRQASRCSNLLRTIIVHVCYFIVLTPLRLIGSRFAPEGASFRWTDAVFPPLDSRPSRSIGWIRRYLVWARETSNLWALSLLPFLLLLRTVETDRAHSLSDRLYTLF